MILLGSNEPALARQVSSTKEIEGAAYLACKSQLVTTAKHPALKPYAWATSGTELLVIGVGRRGRQIAEWTSGGDTRLLFNPACSLPSESATLHEAAFKALYGAFDSLGYRHPIANRKRLTGLFLFDLKDIEQERKDGIYNSELQNALSAYMSAAKIKTRYRLHENNIKPNASASERELAHAIDTIENPLKRRVTHRATQGEAINQNDMLTIAYKLAIKPVTLIAITQAIGIGISNKAHTRISDQSQACIVDTATRYAHYLEKFI